jgi:DNA-binding MarR family transcriptional regulator
VLRVQHKGKRRDFGLGSFSSEPIPIPVPLHKRRSLTLAEAREKARIGIASELGLTCGSVTALIDPLEERVLVGRSPVPDERRSLIVAAEPRAFATVGKFYKECADRICELVATYPDAQAKLAITHSDEVAAVWKAVDC